VRHLISPAVYFVDSIVIIIIITIIFIFIIDNNFRMAK